MTDIASPHSSNAKAERLLALHHADDLLVLLNAWDAASARLVERAGAPAIATTSCGIAWALGNADGERIGRTAMLDSVRRIAAAVELPVTADVEAGYGPSGDDVAETVRGVIDAGAVGINLEDSGAPDGVLFSLDQHADRIDAARRAAVDAGVPDFVINGRTDVYLLGVGEPESRLEEVLRRGRAYADAGASCFFVPGLLNLETLRAIVSDCPIPVNALAMPGGPTAAEFAAAGVDRISVGGRIAEVAYSAAEKTVRDLLTTGAYDKPAGALTYADMNGLFER